MQSANLRRGHRQHLGQHLVGMLTEVRRPYHWTARSAAHCGGGAGCRVAVPTGVPQQIEQGPVQGQVRVFRQPTAQRSERAPADAVRVESALQLGQCVHGDGALATTMTRSPSRVMKSRPNAP